MERQLLSGEDSGQGNAVLLRRQVEYGGNQRHVLPHAAEKHVGELEGTGAANVPFFPSKHRSESPISND